MSKKTELTPAQKSLLEQMTKCAEEAGLEVITKTIPFLDNDIPKYLKMLCSFEEESKKDRRIIGDYQPYAA